MAASSRTWRRFEGGSVVGGRRYIVLTGTIPTWIFEVTIGVETPNWIDYCVLAGCGQCCYQVS